MVFANNNKNCSVITHAFLIDVCDVLVAGGVCFSFFLLFFLFTCFSPLSLVLLFKFFFFHSFVIFCTVYLDDLLDLLGCMIYVMPALALTFPAAYHNRNVIFFSLMVYIVVSLWSPYLNKKVIYRRLLQPQTDRASAFVVDHVKIFLASSLTTMQNLVVASHNVCAHVGALRDLWER